MKGHYRAPYHCEQSLSTGAAKFELRLSTQLALNLALPLAGYQFTYSAYGSDLPETIALSVFCFTEPRRILARSEWRWASSVFYVRPIVFSRQHGVLGYSPALFQPPEWLKPCQYVRKRGNWATYIREHTLIGLLSTAQYTKTKNGPGRLTPPRSKNQGPKPYGLQNQRFQVPSTRTP